MTIPSPDQRTTVEVNRVFPATREQVFRAWTQASALERWFRPMGSVTTVKFLDLRVGGAFQFDLSQPDAPNIIISGYYIEIVRPEKLVFTWQSSTTNNKETLVTVILIESHGYTEVRLTHDRLDDELMILGHQKGWEYFMDTLSTLLAS
jgi:uncharacterized protein YndB with AHSA1/START domain